MPTRVAKTERLLKNASLVIAIGFGLVLAALVAIGILASRSEEADRLVNHTVEVQQAGENLLSELRDAESGQRGFVLTGRNDYVEPVDRAEAKVPTLFAGLKTLTMDNPVQQERLGRLALLIDSEWRSSADPWPWPSKVTAVVRRRWLPQARAASAWTASSLRCRASFRPSSICCARVRRHRGSCGCGSPR